MISSTLLYCWLIGYLSSCSSAFLTQKLFCILVPSLLDGSVKPVAGRCRHTLVVVLSCSLFTCTKGSSRTLSQRGRCISTAKNFSPQNTEDSHSPLPSERPRPGGAQAASTSLFSASHQHPEDLQTQAFTLLSAAIQCPQLTLFLRSHQLVWWQRKGGGFHQPSSHRRAPPEEQTPEESPLRSGQKATASCWKNDSFFWSLEGKGAVLEALSLST